MQTGDHGKGRNTVIWAATQSAGALPHRSSDRRASSRFPIECELRYRSWSQGKIEVGSGRTVDISSGGVRFKTDSPLPSGKRVEVSIFWPAQLDGKCNLKLVASGRVVWTRGDNVAVRIEKYEFRTAGSGSLCAVAS